MSQFPGGGPDYNIEGIVEMLMDHDDKLRAKGPQEQRMREWLEHEVRSAEKRWERQKRTGTLINEIGYARGYWEALSMTLDTFEAMCEGKQ
jgi:hypothetical protein